MDSLTDRVAITGGVVAHNPYLVNMVEEITEREIMVPEHPQLTVRWAQPFLPWRIAKNERFLKCKISITQGCFKKIPLNPP